MVPRETIAALATAHGRGGIAIVRVSGAEAFALAERLTGRKVRPGRFSLCTLREGPDRSVLDEAVVLAFPSPHSYTGEDVVEFQCHGGEVTPRRILEACFSAGARGARKGEFTQRAFLNGRLDLEQAQAVLDLIDAKTAAAADAALSGLSGAKRKAFRDLYERVLALGADLEHALDINEGELPPRFFADVADRRDALVNALTDVLRRLNEGKILRQGALVVLSGPPNAGKSSLMNALLQENHVLVSEQPGTTRDSIEEWCDLDGWPVRLVDTAGLRQTDDAVEAEGVRRAEKLAAEADLVLFLSETGTDWPDTVDARTVRVLTKCDLRAEDGLPVHEETLRLSSKTGFGLDALKRRIVERLKASFAAEEISSSISRHSDAGIGEQAACLLGAAKALLVQAAEEGDLVLMANAVRAAGERLGEAVGERYSSDMLDRLFSRFCVGK